MITSPWRRKAAQVIQRVITEVGTEDPKALRKAISEAYPFGQRAMHPYKIWLSEVARQLAPPKPAHHVEPTSDGPLIDLMR